MTKKLLLNSLSGTVLYAVNVAVAFIMCPVLISALGNRDYGLWELVMSVIGYMGLLDLGIGGSLVRFVSVADGSQDKNDLQQTISTAFSFFVGVGFVALISFFYLGYSPGLIAGSETKNIANLSTVFILLGIDAAMLFPQQVFIATLMGVQRHYFINNIRIVLVIVRACLTYYLLLQYHGYGLIILALQEPVFNAIQLLLFAGAVYLDKNIPEMALSAVTIRKAKEMITFGVKSASMLFASRLQNQSVPLIIGNVIGLGQIVYFVMPNRLVDYAKGAALAVGFPLTPYFGAAIGRGNHDEVVKSWLETTLVLQIVSLAMPIVIFFSGEVFLRLWIGQEYANAGRIVMYILLVGLVADSLSANAFRILTAQGKHGKSAMVWLIFSALSIPFGIWGANQWGVAGVAAGTTAVTILANLITVYMACTVMKVPLFTYFNKTSLRIILPLLLLAVAMWLLNNISPAKSYLDLLLYLVLSGFIYVLSIWRFTLGKDVQKHLIDGLKLTLINACNFFSLKFGSYILYEKKRSAPYLSPDYDADVKRITDIDQLKSCCLGLQPVALKRLLHDNTDMFVCFDGEIPQGMMWGHRGSCYVNGSGITLLHDSDTVYWFWIYTLPEARGKKVFIRLKNLFFNYYSDVKVFKALVRPGNKIMRYEMSKMGFVNEKLYIYLKLRDYTLIYEKCYKTNKYDVRLERGTQNCLCVI